MSDITLSSSDEMNNILELQKRAQLRAGAVSAQVRIDRLRRAIGVLESNSIQFCEAMSEDFGNRSIQQSKMTDIDAAIAPLKHAIKHLHNWMKPEKRTTTFPFNLLGGRSHIE